MQNLGAEYWTDEAGCKELEVKMGFASLEAPFHTVPRMSVESLKSCDSASENFVNRGRHDVGVDSSRLCLMRIVPKSLVGQNPRPGCGCL